MPNEKDKKEPQSGTEGKQEPENKKEPQPNNEEKLKELNDMLSKKLEELATSIGEIKSSLVKSEERVKNLEEAYSNSFTKDNQKEKKETDEEIKKVVKDVLDYLV